MASFPPFLKKQKKSRNSFSLSVIMYFVRGELLCRSVRGQYRKCKIT